MSNVPAEYKYTKKHEWVKLGADGTATIGITDFAQHALGDIVYIDVPAVGRSFSVGDSLGVIESVKAAEDLYAPLAGTVVESNAALKGNPALVNSDPYGQGWFVKVKTSTVPGDLLDSAAYSEFVKTLG